MLPSCLLHPEKAADINASKRRGSFGFTHGKYDKYMSMVIAAQVLTCLLLLTFHYVRKVQRIFSYVIFFFRVMKLVFSCFQQTNQINTTLKQIPIRSFEVAFPFLFSFFKFGSSFSPQVSRSAGCGIGGVCFIFVQLCLSLLKGSWNSKIPNAVLYSSFEKCIYLACILHVLYIYSVKMVTVLIKLNFFKCLMEVVFF